MSKPKKSRKKAIKKTASPPKAASLNSNLPDWFTNSRLYCIVLMIFGFLLYVNTLTHDYTQDDAIVIYDNMYTTKGLKGIPGILKDDTFFGFFKEEGKANLVSGGRYRPFTLMMYALEVQLFAPKKIDANGNVVRDKDGDIVYDPKGIEGETNAVKVVGHLVNILLYGLTGVVLYLLLLNLMGFREKKLASYFVALSASFIFLAHPVHTEAVANIKGRDEIMVLLGSLAAAYFIVKAWQKESKFSIAAAICFFIALMSKENAITFIGVVPLMLYIFTKAKVGDILLHSLALVVPAVLFLIIRSSVLPSSGIGEVSMELMNNPYLKIEGGRWVHFTAGERMATIFTTLGEYLRLLVFPHPLTHDYYPRHIDIMTWSDLKSIMSLLIHFALLAYGIFGLLKKDLLSFGILFYFGTLFIVSNILFPVGTNMSERFLFMPSVGFCFIAGVLLFRLYKTMNKAKKFDFKNLNLILVIVGVISIAFSIKTISRNEVWQDNFTLFTTDVNVSENSAKLQNAVGGDLTRKFKDAEEPMRTQKLTEATQHLEKALQIHPTYKNSYLQLGNVNNYLKQYEKSIEYYNKVLSISPGDEDATNNLGITYRDAGRFYGEQQGDLNKAINYLEKAYQFRPDEYETLRLLGVAYGVGGRQDKALDYFIKALALNPENPDALWNLGNAYFNNGNEAKGTELRQKAIAIDPEVANRNRK